MWGVEIDVTSVWGIEDDLISMWESELTWFCVGVGNDLVRSLDRYTLNFRVGGHEKLIVYRVGIEIDLTSVLGSKLTWFCVRGRN